MVRLTENQAKLLRAAIADSKDYDVQRMVENIDHQLEHPNHGADLIDTVARLVMDPRIRGSNANLVPLLRDAILTPRELARVKALENAPYTCAGCKRQLQQSEMVSTHGLHVFCTTCHVPDSVTCPGCHEQTPLNASLRRAIGRAGKACTKCNPAMKKHVGAPEPVEDTPARPDAEAVTFITAPQPDVFLGRPAGPGEGAGIVTQGPEVNDQWTFTTQPTTLGRVPERFTRILTEREAMLRAEENEQERAAMENLTDLQVHLEPAEPAEE